MAQVVKNLRATQETWVWSLGWEDALEKGMATHSSILAWEIPVPSAQFGWELKTALKILSLLEEKSRWIRK